MSAPARALDTRESRDAYLREHAEAVYEELTGGYQRSVRVEDLVFQAAELIPGLLPTRVQIESEREHLQADKQGLEIDQGIFLARLLSQRRPGLHLVHSMLGPKAESLALLAEFRRTGAADLGLATVRRDGKVGIVENHNSRFLNAEDDAATAALETGVDLVLLDPEIEVGVLRGSVVDHPRHAGRRVFNAGINLTHLYHGRISLVNFMVARELGLLSKILRGHWLGGDFESGLERTHEKPWIAAVEAFAIGGGCQLLLVMDRVLAERGAYFNLPARKEGIIPGAANLRLPRFVGERVTRQAIMFEKGFPADSPEGALLCDEVVEPGFMDEAIARNAAQLTSSGLVSAAANRKAIRTGQEPIDLFRAYMAVYAREQAECLYSPALIRNLRENWKAHERRL